MMSVRKSGALALGLGAAMCLSGCEAALLIGGMAQNWEYQKLVQVLPEYDLEHKSIAVIVDADLGTLYEHPDLIAAVAGGVSGRIANNVEGARVVHPDLVIAWQYQVPQWNAMPFGEIAEALDVDRVVYIDIFEYRLNPPGNQWEWEGVCAAHVGIIERGGYAPDTFADSFTVTAEFPSKRGVDRDSADRAAIQTGVLSQFIQRTAWLFYEHERPKYPDKYRPGR